MALHIIVPFNNFVPRKTVKLLRSWWLLGVKKSEFRKNWIKLYCCSKDREEVRTKRICIFNIFLTHWSDIHL